MRMSWDKNWQEIERKLGTSGLESFIQNRVMSTLSDIDPHPGTKDGFPKAITTPIMIGFVAFFITFIYIESQLPRNGLGTFLSFLAFPTIFISFMALTLFLIRDKIAQIIEKAQHNFLIRSRILGDISELLNMHYVPTPGGTSEALKLIAKWKHCPKTIRDVVDLMEKSGGLDIQSDVIRRSGLAMPSDYVLGSKDHEDKFYAQAQKELQFQDGFSGTHKGIDFTAMEWEESHDDFSYHHLLIYLKLPYRLTGWVEFKNKASGWPRSRPNTMLKKIGIPYSPFTKAYDVRATDQTEGRLVFDPIVIEQLSRMAKDMPARGVAFEDHLVFDIRGDNRFELVNIATGQWTEDTIFQTFSDIAQMFELIESASKAFVIKRPAARNKAEIGSKSHYRFLTQARKA